MQAEEKFNHKIANLADKIRLVGELEHARFHAIRSAGVSTDEEAQIHYLVIAKQARDLRRDYMAYHFPDLSDEDWCLVKSAATLKQIAYEVEAGDTNTKEIDALADSILSFAFHEDMTGCKVCAEDKKSPS